MTLPSLRDQLALQRMWRAELADNPSLLTDGGTRNHYANGMPRGNTIAVCRHRADALYLARRHNRGWHGKSQAFIRLNPVTTARYGRRCYDVFVQYLESAHD